MFHVQHVQQRQLQKLPKEKKVWLISNDRNVFRAAVETFFFHPTWSFSIIRHELLGDRSHAGVWCSFHIMSTDIFASLSLRRHHERPVPRCQTQPQLLFVFLPLPLLVFDPNGGVSVCLLTPKRAPATAFILTAVCRFAGTVKLINLPALTFKRH